ncbi:golgin subfamily A member 1 isoform X2 [Bradysia coprophila]|uniref:golgin subfamily A member 1 isoform X2 n=1 Tax=Bradysia coprophila TaxID=38358 RepID=UPI00187D94AE|nr:golgin subfamily A member 1 isoform X2 [Bradysia coprophila]
MFATLKNKIKEETGNEVPHLPVRTAQNRYQRGTLDSTSSVSIESLSMFEQKEAELSALRAQFNDINCKYNDLSKRYNILQDDMERLEKANELLEESVKVSQVQKELIYDEQDKIQNLQAQEIAKLKNLLNFREQEALDRLTVIKQTQQQLDHVKSENKQLREMEAQREEIEDELERLRHASQMETNNYKTNMACLEEQNRHLLSKLNVLEEARFNFTSNISNDEKVNALIQERKFLEQRLEEAHIQLSDIKSNWSAQNLALETQKQCEQETTDLKTRLTASDDRLNDHIEKSEVLVRTLRSQIAESKDECSAMSNIVEDEKKERATILLQNAEISQELSILKQELKSESAEVTELSETNQKLQQSLHECETELSALRSRNEQLEVIASEQKSKTEIIDELNKDLSEKNKSIKLLKQRLADFKKTLQNEFKGSVNHTTSCLDDNPSETNHSDGKTVSISEKVDKPTNHCTDTATKNRSVVMDEVNFKYLKHVILKFLTSREVEARHLIRAVGTLLQLSQDEEKLLHDTLSFRMSWFGTRPESKLHNFI